MLKKKAAQIPKLESALETYRQRMEDNFAASSKIDELRIDLEKKNEKIRDLEGVKESLNAKMDKYKAQIAEEKNKNINLEIDLTRKVTEIENMKNEKRRTELTIADLEAQLHDAQQQIEQLNLEKEELSKLPTNGALTGFINDGSDFYQITAKLEKELEDHRKEHGNKPGVDEVELEILQKENEVLKAKCKEIQVENEELKLKVKSSESVLKMEKLLLENETLREDLKKLKAGGATGGNTAGSIDLPKIKQVEIELVPYVFKFI